MLGKTEAKAMLGKNVWHLAMNQEWKQTVLLFAVFFIKIHFQFKEKIAVLLKTVIDETVKLLNLTP